MIFSTSDKSVSNAASEQEKVQIQSLLATLSCQVDFEQIQPLSGDGSDRRFYRITGKFPCLAVLPSPTHPQAMAEARASYTIACHLSDIGVPVPQVLGYDRTSRLVLFEDVGDLHLHSLVAGRQNFKDVQPFYEQAVDGLLQLQVNGVKGFDTRCCWDTVKYDMDLMIQRESGYFLQAFCKDYLGKIVNEHVLNQEFLQLAKRAAQEPADFLLHRDFQSRNLMVHENKVRIIDFQGARLGPLAYDLASLLIDPYAALTEEERQVVFNYYLRQASNMLSGFDVEHFQQGYRFLALQRNLQILGAFAFLSQQKGKSFFEQYIIPATNSLLILLQPVAHRFPYLIELAHEIKDDLHEAATYAQASDFLSD